MAGENDPMRGGQYVAPKPPPPGPQPQSAPPYPGAAPPPPPAAPPPVVTQPPAPAPVPVVIPPPVDPPPAPAPAAGQPFAVFHTPEQFNERVERATRSTIKKALGTDLENAGQALARLKQLEEAEQVRQQQTMTEVEREKAARAKAEADYATEKAARERAELDAHILKVCASKGIRDTDYARYRILQKLDSLPENEELDEGAFLDGLIKDPASAAALGIGAPPTVAAPITTTPVVGAPPPVQPPPNTQPPPKTAYDLTPDEWNAKRRALGIA